MEIANQINIILSEYAKGNKLSSYKKIIKIFKKNKENEKLRFNVAVIEQDLDLNENAIKNYRYLIENHNHKKSMMNLYLLLIKEFQYNEALQLIEKILIIDNSLLNVWTDKAYVLYKIENIEESIKVCNFILKNKTDDLYIQNILASCFLHKELYHESEKLINEGLRINSNFLPLLNTLGKLHYKKRNLKDSEQAYLKALEVDPESYQSLNNLASFYQEIGRSEDALTYYKKAKAKKPNYPIILNNIAKTYLSLNKTDEAESYCLQALELNSQKGLELNSQNDEIKKQYSLILLKKLEFKKAWLYFDGRLGLSDFAKQNTNFNIIKSKLNNEKLNRDSKILILREQGVGDELLYGSMYKDLLQYCPNSIIECDERLLNMFQCSFDKKYKNNFVKLATISRDADLLLDIDRVIYAGSLGKFFRNNIESFPQNPYLKIGENKINKMGLSLKQLTKKYKVGISWKSFKNDYAYEKSLELSDLKNVFELSEIDIINLQYGNIKNELEDFCNSSKYSIFSISNLDLFNDLESLAGVLKNLNLFISVSNSTAHLAASLGVKTLLLKPINQATFHYWNQPGKTTPWYKDIHLENQKILNNENEIKKIIQSMLD